MSISEAALDWVLGTDTGVSSLTIWSVMTGREMPGYSQPDVPRDPADFGRCHRLLEMFPSWRPRLVEVVTEHAEWTGLVACWGELEALYLEELPSGRGPKTWARMKELRGEGYQS